MVKDNYEQNPDDYTALFSSSTTLLTNFINFRRRLSRSNSIGFIIIPSLEVPDGKARSNHRGETSERLSFPSCV